MSCKTSNKNSVAYRQGIQILETYCVVNFLLEKYRAVIIVIIHTKDRRAILFFFF